MKLSEADLSSQIAAGDKQVADAESHFKTEVEKLQRDRHTLHSLVTIKFVMNVQRKRANVIKTSRHLMSEADKVAPQDDLCQSPVAFLRSDK